MKKELIVGSVEKSHAIDFTPLYRITLHKNLSAGTVLLLDAAESLIVKESGARDVS